MGEKYPALHTQLFDLSDLALSGLGHYVFYDHTVSVSTLMHSNRRRFKPGLRSDMKQKWRSSFCVFSYIGKTDSITISIWNHKKIHKRQGAGFLGCIRLLSNAISRLKDTGCKFVSCVWSPLSSNSKVTQTLTLCFDGFPPDQRLDLCKLNPSDSDAVRGHIVGKPEQRGHFLTLFSFLSPCADSLTLCLFSVSLQTRERIGSGGPVVDCRGLLENDGWVTFTPPTSSVQFITKSCCYCLSCPLISKVWDVKSSRMSSLTGDCQAGSCVEKN